nr:hypothetical protein [Bacteroides acidifaciens]
MVTVTISIKPYLAAYMYARHGQNFNPQQPIQLSPLSPLYHMIHQLTTVHPKGASYHSEGNITFVIPTPAYGKNPLVYNYIGHDHSILIETEIMTEMKTELYPYLLYSKYQNGVMFKKSMEAFVDKYGLAELVREETLMQAFQRWRGKLKKNEKK